MCYDQKLPGILNQLCFFDLTFSVRSQIGPKVGPYLRLFGHFIDYLMTNFKFKFGMWHLKWMCYMTAIVETLSYDICRKPMYCYTLGNMLCTAQKSQSEKS